MTDDRTNTLSSATTAAVLPPPAILVQMMTGYGVSQAICVAAKLKVADLLADGAQTHAPSLRRLLRALASVGIFTEANHDTFALTPLAMLLRSGTPNSMAALAIMDADYQGSEIMAGAMANRTDTVVGLSNLFAPAEASVAFWAGCVATAQATFPGLPLVGYESGPDLAFAEAVGFEKLQTLRVWTRSP